MKVLVEGKDISQVIEQLKWSGDTKQPARTVEFSIVKNKSDKNFPYVVINEGDKITVQDNKGSSIFGGIVLDVDKTSSAKIENYVAYDFMFYINNSDVSKIFDGLPETIVPEICSELGVECGSMAPTGVHVEGVCLGRKAYEAIMMVYTAAAKQTGSKYIPLITDVNKVSVIEKGKLCGVVMDGSYDMVDATYKSTLQKLVNRVLITDKSNNVVTTVEDADSIQKYGVVQKVLKQEGEEDATEKAKKMLVTTEASGSVSGIPNDFRAVSGYSLVVKENDSGLCGKFYIESDVHTFTQGKSQMELTLAFENIMDEMEMETAS